MTLYDHLVLHHYKYHLKHQPLAEAMKLACQDSKEAMKNYTFSKSREQQLFDSVRGIK